MDRECFCEPPEADTAPMTRSEDVPALLRRSTRERAKRIRKFLNQNLDLLPKSARTSMCQKLHVFWESGLFELIVARTLQ